MQRIGVDVQSPVTQMLQPMHSRMSSSRPSSIFTGRNGSAIDGRAAPIRSITPSRISRTIVSGEVSQPMPTTGFDVSCFEAAEVLLRPGLMGEARGARVVGPEADHDVPDVGQLADEREQLLDLGPLDALLTEQLVDDEPARDGRAALALLERVLEHLAEQARAVLERPAVLVVAQVVAAGEEVLERRQPVRRVDVDEVVARAKRPLHRLPVASAEVADVLTAHRPRLHRLVGGDRQVRRAERRDPSVEVPFGHAVVHELDPGERAVRMHLLDEPLVRRDVGVVPEAALDVAADVRGGMDLDLLGADDGPAALRLDAAHDGMCGRVAVTHAVAVRHLEEAVTRRHRPELHRLEEDVIARVAGH